MNMHTPDEDPIVAEVRRFREEYAAKFGYDLKLRRFAARNEADDKSNGAP
jgi:hypothetical protein